jgi:hypothetical protein
MTPSGFVTHPDHDLVNRLGRRREDRMGPDQLYPECPTCGNRIMAPLQGGVDVRTGQAHLCVMDLLQQPGVIEQIGEGLARSEAVFAEAKAKQEEETQRKETEQDAEKLSLVLSTTESLTLEDLMGL